MRPITVKELALPIRKVAIKAGFKLRDAAEKAVRESALAPTSNAEATVLAKLAKVPRTTVLSWMRKYRKEQAAIQAERLELLGPAHTNFTVYVCADGVVCGHKDEVFG